MGYTISPRVEDNFLKIYKRFVLTQTGPFLAKGTLFINFWVKALNDYFVYVKETSET